MGMIKGKTPVGVVIKTTLATISVVITAMVIFMGIRYEARLDAADALVEKLTTERNALRKQLNENASASAESRYLNPLKDPMVVEALNVINVARLAELSCRRSDDGVDSISFLLVDPIDLAEKAEQAGYEDRVSAYILGPGREDFLSRFPSDMRERIGFVLDTSIAGAEAN